MTTEGLAKPVTQTTKGSRRWEEMVVVEAVLIVRISASFLAISVRASVSSISPQQLPKSLSHAVIGASHGTPPRISSRRRRALLVPREGKASPRRLEASFVKSSRRLSVAAFRLQVQRSLGNPRRGVTAL